MDILRRQCLPEEKDLTEEYYKKELENCETMADQRMTEVIQDQQSKWDDLTEQEVAVISERCSKLFKHIVTTPIESLREWRYTQEIDTSNLSSQGNPPFDADCAKYIVARYEEKGDLEFEKEFGMGRDVMVLAMLYGVWEEANATNINFTPLCDYAKMDIYTYCFLKRGLRSHIEFRDDIKAMQTAIYEAFCSPLDLALLLTLAMAELAKWPLKAVEWEKVTGEPEMLTVEDLKMIDEDLKEEARRLWNAAPQMGRNYDSTREVGQKLVREMESLKTNSEICLGAISRCIESCKDDEFEEMKAAQRKKNQERIELLNNYIPQFAVENDPITDDIIRDMEKDAEETVAECTRLRQLLTVKQLKTLKERFTMKTGQFCLAREDPLDVGFQEAQIVKQVNETTYVVRFLKENGMDDVTLGLQDIANAELPLCEPEFERIGHMALRVVAWVDIPYQGWQWCPGTVAARAMPTHGYDLLVFYDNNFEGYVEGGPKLNRASKEVALYKQSLTNKPRFSSEVEAFEWLKPILREMKIFPICQQVFSPCGNRLMQGDVHTLIEEIPTRRHFLQRYFAKHPFWPLVTMKRPSADRPPQQVLCVDALKKTSTRIMAYCVHVDRHMCVLRFPPKTVTPGTGCFEYPCTDPNHKHRDEWLFRGSPRLNAVNMEDSDNTNLSSRQKMRNRKKFESSAAVDPTETNKIFFARKSGVPQAEPQTGYRNRMAEAAKRKQDKEKAKQFTLVPVRLPDFPDFPKVAHDRCSRGCLHGLDRLPVDKEFQGMSPLVIPIICGWKRSVFCYHLRKSGRHRKVINKAMYRAPCGVTLRNILKISQFLQDTESNLTIDLFCFDGDVDILNVVNIDPKTVMDEDYTNGNEFYKIPAVNTLDDDKPPHIVYGARRFPFNDNVDISTINSNFCSGCTCNGDCSDASRCECQKLTMDNVHRLARTFRPYDCNAGYEYRSLRGKTLSGVFECNENCSCNKKKCFNRVVQNEIKYPLQLFKTAGCGWGVRAMSDIPKGAFIANYVGALMTDLIADNESFRGHDAYFADLDLNDVVESEKMSALAVAGYLDTGIVSDEDPVSDDDVEVPHESDASESDSDEGKRLSKRVRRNSQQETTVPTEKRTRRRKMNAMEIKKMNNTPEAPQKVFKWEEYFGKKLALYVLDAKNKGNIGRFLNHSCDPNVEVQHVLVDTHDLRLPWSAFFACKNIKAGEELCWNYGYQVDELDDSRPLDLQLFCECGAAKCQGRLI